MEREEFIFYILNSNIFKKWHFFKYHFAFQAASLEFVHPLAKTITDLAFELETLIPGAGKDYIDKIGAINDRQNDTKHYDQLLQVLAELIIVHKAATYNWGPKGEVKLKYEPKIGTSNKNPELTITTDSLNIGIEVKAPEFVQKHNERGRKPYQLPSRSPLINKHEKAEVMLPRDNPLKDFLKSADKKFEEFKKADPNFYGILVIVWDDFIYEPITALTSPQAGLFTENSFAKDSKGNILKFPNVDCVILTRHLLPIKCGTRDEPLPDFSLHPLDFGRDGEFPFKVFIQNPWNKLQVPGDVIKCFQVLAPSPRLGAEYLPIDYITWMNIDKPKE